MLIKALETQSCQCCSLSSENRQWLLIFALSNPGLLCCRGARADPDSWFIERWIVLLGSKSEEAEELSEARERVMGVAIPPLLYKAHALFITPPKERIQAMESAAESVVKDVHVAFVIATGIRAVDQRG